MSFIDEDGLEKKEEIREDILQFVTFSLNQELFAVDIFQVQEIINKKEIRKIPNAPDFIEGVIDVRDMIVPIIDLKKRFMLKNDNQSKYIILVNIKDKIFGILIDNVSEVLKIAKDTIHEPPEIVSGINKKYLRGIAKINNSNQEHEELIIILDLSTILSEEEMNKI